MAASILATAFAGPAEARRRHHHHVAAGGGGGYSPPYAAMVVDANTGKTLYAENEDAPRHPASVTKVMTLYLLFEQIEKGRLRLDSPLKVTSRAERQAPSKLGLRAGDEIDVEDAIKAVVTKSANDIAVTIAENIGGSEDAFAEMMTRKARQLGMKNTVYVNASGLPDNRQITTARDLVTLGRAIQERFPRFYAYFGTRSFAYNGAVHRNHNHLLGRVEGMDGIKTGYTRMSGFNLLTSVRAGGRHVVAVVLGGRSASARDRQMVSLIDTYTDKAYAGGHVAPPMAEGDAVAEADVTPATRPAAAKEAPAVRDVPMPVATVPARDTARPRLVAYSDDSPDTTASLPVKLPKPIVDPSAARPVVASAAGGSPTTPSSGMKWVVGAQAARPDAAKSDTTRTDSVTRVAKLDAKADDAVPTPLSRVEAKVEARLAVPEARPRSAAAGWIIQLGATDDQDKARDILQRARSQGGRALSKAEPFTEKVSKGGATLYRARFSGFDAEDAQSACKSLQKSGFSCFAARGG